MTLYTRTDLGLDAPLSLQGYRPTLGASMKNAAVQAFEMNPEQSHMFNIANAQTGIIDFEGESDADFVNFAQDNRENPLAVYPVEDQKRDLEILGLEGALTPHEGYTQETWNIITEAKLKERARAATADRAPGWHWFPNILAGLGASMASPINLASAFVPGMPLARTMTMLHGANGFMGRRGVQLLEGAIGGATGAAAIEPIVIANQKMIQADYDFTNSLMNIAFGTAMGAGFKGIGGGIAELWRNRYNARRAPDMPYRPHPWEYAVETRQTRKLRDDMAEREYKALLLTEKGKADPDAARMAADDSARLYDQFARRMAWVQKQDVAQVYKDWKIDFSGPEPRAVRIRPERASLDQEREYWGASDTFLDDIGQPMTRRQAEQARQKLEADRWEWGVRDTFFEEGARRPAEPAPEPGKAAQTEAQTPAPINRPSQTVKFDPLWDRDPAEVARLRLEGLPDEVIADALPVVEPLWDRDPELVRLYRERGLTDDVIADALPVVRDERLGPGGVDTLHQSKLAELPETQNQRQLAIEDGNATIRGELNPRIAEVVEVDPSILVNKKGERISFKDKRALSEWVQDHFRDRFVRIEDSGEILKLLRKGLDAGLKRRGKAQRDVVSGLDTLLEKAIFHEAITADARHEGKVAGQRIYYSAMKIGDGYYSVRFKLDVAKRNQKSLSYKDHYVAEIQIEPSLGHFKGDKTSGVRANGSIRGISLAVLMDRVKPSRIENGVLSQSGVDITGRRASVSFLGYHHALIRFFHSADLTSAPHELYHIMRRQLEEYATGPNATPQLRDMWLSACEFVGAAPGQAWTRAMEEKFAQAAERYLIRGRAPTAQLQPLFERMKERFEEVYIDANAMGYEISPAMQATFDRMLTPTAAEGEVRFQQALHSILNDDPNVFDPAAMLDPNSKAWDGTDIEAAIHEVEPAMNRLVENLERRGNGPEDAQMARDIRNAMEIANKDIQAAERRGKAMEALIACQTM